MRLHRCLRACGWIAIFALDGAANRAVSVPPSAPPSAWKIVDAFQMKVKVYPRAAGSDRASPTTKDAKPIASFDVHAVLLPVLPFEECGCWKLQFVSFSKSPEFKNPYRLWIDKGNSYTRKANRFVGPQELTLAPTEVVPMVLEAPPGFPVEFIPELENATLPTERKDTTLEISSRTVDNVIERKAIVRMNGKPEIEIRQRWLPGAKWWSEYERFYRGQLDLQASLIVPKAAMPLPTPPRPLTPLGPDDFRSDPRLKIRITTELHNRPLQDLLDLLSQKSGVELKMDAALAAVEPGFGGSTLIGVPAW